MHREAPSDVDHPPADAGIAGPRKSSLTSLLAALVRCTCEARISRDGLSIPQLTGEDLVDKHVCRLNADANDAAQESDARRALVPWSLLDLLYTCFFNPVAPLLNNRRTRDITARLRQCARRHGNALGGT